MLLKHNYHSAQPILDALDGVMCSATECLTETPWMDHASTHRLHLVSVRNEAEQARCVAKQMLYYHEGRLALELQAMLFCTASHSTPLEIGLTRHNVPFVKYDDLKFLKAAHVKDMLSILR